MDGYKKTFARDESKPSMVRGIVRGGVGVTCDMEGCNVGTVAGVNETVDCTVESVLVFATLGSAVGWCPGETRDVGCLSWAVC